MKRGEQARFIIRSDYGYGDGGSGEKIPPKATLVFDVELFDFHAEDLSTTKDQGILKRVLKSGEGYSTPNEGATVSVYLKGTCQDRVFDERDLDYEVGEGSKLDIIEGVEVALQKIKKNEHAKLFIKSKYAWGRAGNAKFGIAPDTDVVYEVILKNFEKCKESW
jgi:FK506-binding protein 4/5